MENDIEDSSGKTSFGQDITDRPPCTGAEFGSGSFSIWLTGRTPMNSPFEDDSVARCQRKQNRAHAKDVRGIPIRVGQQA